MPVTNWPASDFGQPNNPGDWTLEEAYEEIGIELTIDSNTSKVTPLPWPLQCDPQLPLIQQVDCIPQCVSMASMDQQVGCTKEGAGGSSGWYAHGLSVPWMTEWIANGTGGCAAYDGVLWLAGGYCPPNTPVGAEGVRQDFVLFHNVMNNGRQRLEKGIHELSHVLNIHHADHGEELVDEGRLTPKGKTHVCTALKHSSVDDERYDHVLPGPAGSPWCSITNRHLSLHDDFSCDADPAQFTSQPGASLTLRAQTPSFCQDEPVTLEVELATTQDVMYRGKESLVPYYGFLLLYLRNAAGDFEPLPMPLYWEWEFNQAYLKLDADASVVKPIDISYGTGIDATQSFEIMARYAGFDTRTMVESLSLTVVIPDPPIDTVLCDSMARDLFNNAEASRAVWLQGGYHLERGLEDLKNISDNYASSAYAMYANSALVLNYRNPFYMIMDDADNSLKYIPPNPAEEQKYLLRLAPDLNKLPSYYRLLHEVPHF